MDVLTLSRFQFGDTAAFHILWPLLSIGLALFMLVLESAWLYTRDERYYRQTKFWSKIFVLTFGIGVATGIPLEFEFGTNWATFSNAAGDFFGNILGFESTVAFALEAGFLGIFVFGWNRVGKWTHLFSNAMVGLGATLSGFWIMVANSWMQVPVGVTYTGGKLVVTDYMVALFNPESLVSFFHMQIACVETSLFFVGGISAAVLLTRGASAEHKTFFLHSFKFALGLAIFVAPLQIFVGDVSGQAVATYQPEKLAALELHYKTNPPGKGAPWSIIAWPKADNSGNLFEVNVPNGLSLITTHSMTGTVRGSDEFKKADIPTPVESVLTFYSFRIMLATGVAMFLLMLWGAWYWWRGKLTVAGVLKHRWFWRLWMFSIPLGFIATEAGWMVREIGRQPWVVYHLMRVSEGLSPNLSAGVVGTTLALFTLMYIAFGALFIYFTYRIVKNGPDLVTPVSQAGRVHLPTRTPTDTKQP